MSSSLIRNSPVPPCSILLYILSFAICSFPIAYFSIISSRDFAVFASIGIIPSKKDICDNRKVFATRIRPINVKLYWFH